ncbi:ribonuclease D [Pseudovibrio exalbescens]|uniref:ribonuclease D n=1 Tax=Pseudovibrio exalbescens TaxID=197461 RepID=UPI0023653167|nr:ribonuclease D [Pseudovibrio exalbescens]MDD7908884.1 ribonuclease D [Pseudovibrio exalbescens]
MITTTDELAKACELLAQSDFVTIDTEFLRETTFWPKLCVIQMASPDDAVIIDALAEGLDLEPFFDLMRNEAVTKVFHAARQDIEIIYHLGGFVPSPVFDSQVAAMVCGFGDSVSYDQLVQKITGTAIDKSSRFTDWSRRPLTEKQLAYALADVTHLRNVYRYLIKRLEEQGRAHWVGDEMQTLTSEETYRSDPDKAWQRLKLRVRKPRDLAILKELAAWRESEAQGRDTPRSRVLKDDAIYEISMQHPKSAEALSQLRTIPKGFERSKHADGILKAVARGLAVPEEELPELPKGRPAPDGSGAAVDLLKVLLKMTSENSGVAPKVIATVEDLEKIAADDEADVAALKGWRRELFGEPALRLKRGEVAIAFNGRQVVLCEQGEPVERVVQTRGNGSRRRNRNSRPKAPATAETGE